jgi:hypothetical protein
MCYDEGLWQAYLDGEMEPEEEKAMERHLQSCTRCQQLLEKLRSQDILVGTVIKQYQNQIEKLRYNASLGWDKFAQKEVQRKSQKGVFNMLSFSRRNVVAAAVVITMAGSLAFAPVRSAAAQFLQVFRVERVETVTLTLDDIQKIRNSLAQSSGKVDMKELGKIEFEGKQEVKRGSIQEIKESADFTVKTPQYLPAGYKNDHNISKEPLNVTFNLNPEKVNKLIQALGGNKLLPENIKDKTFKITVPHMITLYYRGQDSSGNFAITQGKSPQLDVPDDVNVRELREAVLNLPILPPHLKSQLAGIDDWQHTMVIPNVEGSAREVQVNGAQGVFVTHGPAPQVKVKVEGNKGEVQVNGHEGTVIEEKTVSYGSLIWQKDGIVYAINGTLDLATALRIAESLR